MRYADGGVIELTDVTKNYGNHPVLADVNLSLGRGVHALLGPNGAGKTTLIGILTTLLRQDAGTIRVLGLDPVRDATELRRRISVTGQFAAVDGVLTGAENLMMMGRLLGLSRRDARTRAAELLTEFDLEGAAAKRVATYSGGMRRRLDLAVSLIVPTEVLFLDEPTTGLDTRSRLALWQQIAALATAGTTVVLTTQYLEEADHLAEQIALLDQGRIVAQGTPAELKSLVGGDVVRVIDPSGAARRELPTDGTAKGLAAVVADIAATEPSARVELRRPTLDEAFLHLTGRGHTERDAA